MRSFCLPFLVVCTSAQLDTVIPIAGNDQAFVLSGFDFSRGFLPSAFEPIPDCNDNPGTCLQKTADSTVTQYSRLVTTRSDHDDMMNSVTTAEGGGFGVRVSTSVSVMKQTHSSEMSVSLFLGQSSRTGHDVVKDPQGLRLTAGAKTLLQSDPKGFLNEYGPHYIFTIVYGGSFLGHFTLEEKSSSSGSDLGVFAKVDVSEVFFSADASEDFHKSAKDAHNSVNKFSDLKTRGGNVIKTIPDTPIAMGKIFTDWVSSLKASPMSLTASPRSWMDSADVQEIVNSKPKEIRDLFTVEAVTPVTWQSLTEESGKMMVLDSSLEQAKHWPEVSARAALKQGLQDLTHRAMAHDEQIQMVSESDMLARQAEIKNGDFSWFTADAMLDEFARLIPEHFLYEEVTNPQAGSCRDVNDNEPHGFAVWDVTPQVCESSCAKTSTCSNYAWADHQYCVVYGKGITKPATPFSWKELFNKGVGDTEVTRTDDFNNGYHCYSKSRYIELVTPRAGSCRDDNGDEPHHFACWATTQQKCEKACSYTSTCSNYAWANGQFCVVYGKGIQRPPLACNWNEGAGVGDTLITQTGDTQYHCYIKPFGANIEAGVNPAEKIIAV